MAVCGSALCPVCLLLCMIMWDSGSEAQQAEEVEIFNSDKLYKLGWTSQPREEWDEVNLKAGPMLQACKSRKRKTIISKPIVRQDAHSLLMDISFTQENESSSSLKALQVYVFKNSTATFRFSRIVLNQTSNFLPDTNSAHISSHLTHRRALSLGSAIPESFRLGFSYSGKCVLITSIRLYYRRCPGIVSDLVSFGTTGAGSGPLQGSCVDGAVEVSRPIRECNMDGLWGPLQGGCTCKPGHQVMDGTCKACRIGYYKAANESGGCRLCPANTKTHREASERCDCLQGFSRLPSDPEDLGCTKPPSVPVNLSAHHQNDSVLTVMWDPPHDRGGRQEVEYWIKCEAEADAGSRWEACGDQVVFLPWAKGLTDTSVSLMGLNPQHNYRLSVEARNDISTLQGATLSSTATITIHRWKVPPVVITLTPGLNITDPEITPAPQKSRAALWVVVVVLFGSLLLLALIPIVLCACRQNYSKLRSEQGMDLIPLNVTSTYRRPAMVEVEPEQTSMAESAVQLLEGLSGRFLDSLKEILVDRNKLTLGKELGKGEFGSVYEGVFIPEEGVEVKVAVKTMRVGIHSQEDLHEFLKEAEIMKNFDHENVVSVLGVTLQREDATALPVPLVILPYMKHGDLRRFLIATRYGDTNMFVPHQSLLRFMIDIATGMDYLSSQGFLHRDLAARNCMLGDDLKVRVADFGLSKKIYSSNYYRQKVAIRVPVKWMAMESLSESIYTTKSDVWSFGVTMWEIVSLGRTPYPGVHNHELLELLESGHRLKPPEDCSQKLYEVMRSCWDRDPTQRPEFRELTEALKGLLSELPVLEVSQEASYINQGLEVAALVAAASSQDPQTDSGGRCENVYLPTPVGAAAEAKDEDGYLKYFPGSEVKEGDDH